MDRPGCCYQLAILFPGMVAMGAQIAPLIMAIKGNGSMPYIDPIMISLGVYLLYRAIHVA